MRQPDKIQPDTLLTSKQASDLLQVNASSVNKWVEEGHINGFRTPGGHRRIRACDLTAFVRRQGMPIPSALRQAARRRALLVEHDSKQLRQMERSLGQFGGQMEITSTNNAIDALLNIGATAPHFVVLDADLQEVDSLEVCRKLRNGGNGENGGERQRPEVILTRSKLTNDFQQVADASGAQRCLEKPVAREELLEALLLPAEPGSRTAPEA